MKNKLNLYKILKNILKEIRFGNLSNRINAGKFPDDIEFIDDFNNMLETLEYRENMGKELQDIMHGKNEYLKSVFNMINDGIMTLSEDLKILTINDTFASWFRKNKKNLIGEYLPKLLNKYQIFDFNDKKNQIDYSKVFTKDRKNFKLYLKFKKIDVFFSINLKVFTNKQDDKNYFIFAKNITNDINLQKMKDSFIATLTHDLKVPIVAEANVLDLFQKEVFGKNSDAQNEAITNLLTNNKGMLELVTTLLDVYRIEDACYKITPIKFDIQKLLSEQIENIKFISNENNIDINIISTTKNNIIYADKKELGRVIKNILINAIDFSPVNSTIEINLSQTNTHYLIKIIDTGTGITKENLPFIFDRYFTTSKKYRKIGTGLGLYLSKKIIQLHNGDIEVESIPNKKTTFTIKLPNKF